MCLRTYCIETGQSVLSGLYFCLCMRAALLGLWTSAFRHRVNAETKQRHIVHRKCRQFHQKLINDYFSIKYVESV